LDSVLRGTNLAAPSVAALQGSLQLLQSESTLLPIIWHIFLADSSEIACSILQASSWAAWWSSSRYSIRKVSRTWCLLRICLA